MNLLWWYCTILLVAYEVNGLKWMVQPKIIRAGSLRKWLEKKNSATTASHHTQEAFYDGNNSDNNKNNNDNSSNNEDDEANFLENLVDGDLKQLAGTNNLHGDIAAGRRVWADAEAEAEENADTDYFYETGDDQPGRKPPKPELDVGPQLEPQWPLAEPELQINVPGVAKPRLIAFPGIPVPLPRLGAPGVGEYRRKQRRRDYPPDPRFPEWEFDGNRRELDASPQMLDYPERGQHAGGRQHKSVHMNEAVDENEHNPGMFVRVTHKAFNFIAVNLMRKFQEEIKDQSLNEFSRVLMRLNVSVLSPKLTDVEMPELSYRALAENAIKISSLGGSAKVSAKYRAVYKTVREGQLTVQMENFDVNVRIKFTRTFAGYLQLVDMSCDAVIRAMVTRLSPKLHEQIDQGLTDTLAETIQSKICEVIDIYVRKIDARLRILAQYSPVTVEQKSIASQLILDTTLSDEVMLSNGYLDLPLKGDFIAPDDPVRTPFFPSPISKSDDDTDRMIYVYVSDYVINSFFYQLDRLGNFRVNLHLIPEVKQMLSLSCDEGGDRKCLGCILSNPEQYTDGKGRLEARVRSPPVVVLNDVGAHIGLNLSVDLSYKEADEDETVNAVLLTVNVKLQLHAKDLSIRNVSPKHEHQQLRINTTISITHLEVTSAMAYVDSMNDFAMNLPQFLDERRSLIEEIVRKNLHVVIPLSVNDELIGVNSIYGEFRGRTLVLGFDVDLHEQLFEHFSLMNSGGSS